MDIAKILAKTGKILSIFLVSIPLSLLVAFAINPWLSKLESVLQIELTGHSGPSDEVLFAVFIISFSILGFLFRNTK